LEIFKVLNEINIGNKEFFDSFEKFVEVYYENGFDFA
jgi:hypothetical protein